MGVHPSGDGVAWDLLEAIDVNQPHGLDYIAWQHLSKAVRKRIMHEHSEFADATVGGIHKPGGSAVLGMEITDTAGDPTGLVVADGTYRGHGLVWSYITDSTDEGVLWCATAAAGASTTGDWTILAMHPDRQWKGGDVTWAGAHEFDASVDFTGPVAFDNSVIVGADATLEILGDLSVAGTALFDGSVVLTADATLEILGDLSVAGYALFDGSVTLTADSTLSILGDVCAAGIVNVIGICTSQSTGAVDMSSDIVYQTETAGLITASGPASFDMSCLVGSANPPTTLICNPICPANTALSPTFPVPKGWYWKINSSAAGIRSIFWTPFGTGGCASV